jgi:hypothetical protein
LHGTFELLDGFVGHNVIDRKAIESRRSFAARLRKKKYKDTPVELRLTAEELQSFCDEWAVNMYERREHGSLGMSPMQRAAGWTGPVRRIENERALDVLLRPAPSQDGWRTVGKKGVQAGYYYDHPSLRVEALVPGGRVRVLLDETDAARVTCFNERGEWVCDAICPELAGVSREELAAAVKRAQKKALAEDRKDLRGAAKRAQVDTILTDIRRKAATDAAKVTPLPHRSESYSTPALEEAARAADAGATPKAAPLTEAQQKSHEELVRELAGGGERVVQLPPMKDERKARFLRAWRIEQRIEAGQAVDTEEALWLGRYQATPEYKSMRGIFEDFGVEAFN